LCFLCLCMRSRFVYRYSLFWYFPISKRALKAESKTLNDFEKDFKNWHFWYKT
jgi:hypothetical protein